MCEAQCKGEVDKADRGRGGKSTPKNGQAWSSSSPKEQWRTGKNGGNWLWNHLRSSNEPSRLRNWWWWWWNVSSAHSHLNNSHATFHGPLSPFALYNLHKKNGRQKETERKRHGSGKQRKKNIKSWEDKDVWVYILTDKVDSCMMREATKNRLDQFWRPHCMHKHVWWPTMVSRLCVQWPLFLMKQLITAIITFPCEREYRSPDSRKSASVQNPDYRYSVTLPTTIAMTTSPELRSFALVSSW